jgi:predicted Zn-dependent protease
MKTHYRAGWWVVLLIVWIVVLPPVVSGRAPNAFISDGACGGPEARLEASRAGSAMVEQVLSAGIRWDDNGLNEYLNRLGQNLARNSGSSEVFSFYVLYNPAVNAEALPGGFIVINTGAISLAESEDELAYVISHEIAHENSCDWRPVSPRGNLFELIGLVPAVVLGGPAGIAIAVGTGWAESAAHARSHRTGEDRADSLAAFYLWRAGYDPTAATRFFGRLEAEQQHTGGNVGGLMSSHPRTADRRKRLEKLIPTFPAQHDPPHDPSEFLKARRSVLEYDEMYSRLVSEPLPGHEAPLPVLSRRSPPSFSK